MEQSSFVLEERERLVLSVADLTLDTGAREVQRHGNKLYLECKEFQLLEYLLRNRNRIVPRAEILREIWGKEISSHSLDARISSLRKKIDSGHGVKILYTVSRKGYLIMDLHCPLPASEVW